MHLNLPSCFHKSAHRRHEAVCQAKKTPIVPTEVKGSYLYPGEGKVKGICHFIGGAFAGAIPQVVYPGFLSELASNGYTTVATPFPVTFKHLERSQSLRCDFEDVVATVRQSSLSDRAPDDVPVHGVGHSFGALAHSLIGCSSPGIASNVLISFNNKEVELAIPIPGFLSSVQLAFQIYEQTPFKLFQNPIPIVKELSRAALSTSKLTQSADGLLYRTVNDTFDQVDSLFQEIQQGVVNFDPIPTASAELIQTQYDIPDTLLVQSTNDTIDETSLLLDILKKEHSRSISMSKLKGTHLTPCIGDLRWLSDIWDVKFDDEIVNFVQDEAQSEADELMNTIVTWLDSHS